MPYSTSLAKVDDDSFYNLHAFLHFLAWGFMIDIGILVARTLKAKRSGIHYQTLHGSIMTATSLTSSASISLLVYNFGFTLNDLLVADIHKLIGFSIIGFTYLAAGMGAITVYKLRKGGEVSLLFRKIHRAIGYMLYTVTKINILIGAIYLGGTLWMIVLGIYILCIVTIHLTVRSLYRRYSEAYIDPPLEAKVPDSPNHQKLLTLIEEDYSREKIKKEFPGLKWVLVGNKVYDVTKFIHPGGEFLISELVGREISRYLYGAYPSELTNIKAYKHSAFAFKLLEKYYIGKIKQNESILIPVNPDINESVISTTSSTSSTFKLSLPFLTKAEESFYEESTYKKRWKISSKKMMTDRITRFDFSCDNFSIKRFGTGTSWFGKYFLVRFAKKKSPRRPYTIATCLDQCNIEIRSRLMLYIEKLMKGEESELALPEDYFLTRNNISLFIKSYLNSNGLSKMIHECDLNSQNDNQFILEGPIGLGLNLSEINAGTICIICAGTGIIPFLDYLTYIFYRTIYELIRSKKPQAATAMMGKLGIDFAEKMNEHKIHLIGAFQGQNEILGLDILEKLGKLNNVYNLNKFSFELTNCKVENLKKISKKINESYLQASIPKNAERFYICGPPEFSRIVPRILLRAKINKEKIFIV